MAISEFKDSQLFQGDVGVIVATRPTRIRHVVLGMTVAAYFITYLDRVVMSTAVPAIRREFGFSLVEMGWILGAFQLPYALFQIPGGWLGDRFGPRRVLSAIVMSWSFFTVATTAIWSATSMVACRFLFGMAEAGAFPNATRSLSRWMLASERGWAQGLTHAGARLGGAATPALTVLLISIWGWRAPFIVFAGLGVLWAVLWFWYYRDNPRDHKHVNAAELALIESSLGSPRNLPRHVPWKRILKHPQMWLVGAMYICYGYDAGTFLSWFPAYLNEARGFSITQMGFFASLPLMAGVLGDLAGGWASDRWLRRTGNIKIARRIVAIPGWVVASVTILLATLATDPLVSVAYFCVALFALELTVGVSWAVTLDIGAEFAGSVSAVMNTCGNIGGAIATTITAYLVARAGWSAAFLVLVVLGCLAALLFSRIDASKSVVYDQKTPNV
jgi:sugar phosphate permease